MVMVRDRMRSPPKYVAYARPAQEQDIRLDGSAHLYLQARGRHTSHMDAVVVSVISGIVLF